MHENLLLFFLIFSSFITVSVINQNLLFLKKNNRFLCIPPCDTIYLLGRKKRGCLEGFFYQRGCLHMGKYGNCGMYIPLSDDKHRFVQKVHFSVQMVTVYADIMVTHCCHVTTCHCCIVCNHLITVCHVITSLHIV